MSAFGSVLLLVFMTLARPVADPAFATAASQYCIAQQIARGNLFVLVSDPNTICAWTVDDPAMVEISRYYTEFSWWNTARTNNIRLAGAKIDGIMLWPGETFSFNKTVGPRSQNRGFEVSKVIVTNGYRPGIGGGVCQVSSTLHAAAVFAGLDIVERYPHRFRVKYIPPGLDATVDFGRKDLKIRNNTPFPIIFRIGRSGKSGLLARIFAPRKSFVVKYKYKVEKEVPSDTVKFELSADTYDPVAYYGRPMLEVRRIYRRKNLYTGKWKRIYWSKDIYESSPWVIRVTEYPDGKTVLTGLTTEQINAILRGSKYTTESARFSDVEKQQDKWMYKGWVSRKQIRKFSPFSRTLAAAL